MWREAWDDKWAVDNDFTSGFWKEKNKVETWFITSLLYFFIPFGTSHCSLLTNQQTIFHFIDVVTQRGQVYIMGDDDQALAHVSGNAS